MVVVWLRKVHSTCICRYTGLFQKLQAGPFSLDVCICTRGVEMQIVIMGDPKLSALLTQEAAGNLKRSKEGLNY